MNFIPVSRPIGPNPMLAQKFLEESYRLSRFSNFGPLVEQLESEVAARFGVKQDQVVTFSSCTSGLTAAFAATGKARVRLPDFSFIATLSGVLGAGMEPLVVDVDEATWMTSEVDVLPNDTVDCLVLPFGLVDEDRILRQTDYFQVIDAAASFGGDWNLTHLPPEKAMIFSMHATKVMGAGEAGIGVFGDPVWAESARAWSNFGMNCYRQVDRVGANAKMSEFQAAYCLAALSLWSEERDEWDAANRQAREISREFGLRIQQSLASSSPTNYFLVDVDDSDEHKLLPQILNSEGIETRYWWGNSLANLIGEDPKPVSSTLRQRWVGLPMFRGISTAQFGRISDAISTLAKGR